MGLSGCSEHNLLPAPTAIARPEVWAWVLLTVTMLLGFEWSACCICTVMVRAQRMCTDASEARAQSLFDRSPGGVSIRDF